MNRIGGRNGDWRTRFIGATRRPSAYGILTRFYATFGFFQGGYMRRIGVVGVICAFFSLACSSGSSSPTNPTGSQTCRTYVTSSTSVTAATGVTIGRTLSCSFTAANQLSCTMAISTCGSVQFTVSYASRADFVDEVSVIPPKVLSTAQTTVPNACGITDGTFTYDSQKRLLRYTINGLTYAY